MQSHDYLRKAAPSIFGSYKRICDTEEYDSFVKTIFHTAFNAVKFVMPENGKIFDTELAALPEIIKLPYESIVIEYECTNKGGLSEKHFGATKVAPARKRIVIASQHKDVITVASMVCFNVNLIERWQIQPYLACVLTNAKEEDFLKDDELEKVLGDKSVENLGVYFHDICGLAEKHFGKKWQENAYCDMMDECNSVMGLIEALSCKNVGIESLPQRKMNKGAMKRGALPFNDYHILTVTGQSKSGNGSGDAHHRSPREHLRRGHIRRLSTGNTWVNSTVVNAGIGSKIIKTYALETQ